VNRLVYLLFIVFLSSGCSLNKNSSFWSSSKVIEQDKEIDTKIVDEKKIFLKNKILIKEFNPKLKIKLDKNLFSKNRVADLTNNNGRLSFDRNLNRTSRYKFSKIKNFYQSEPEISFYKENVIFFDNKGSILNFDNNSKLIWEKNYYSKSEKKLFPILQLANNGEFLIVADNIAKYYLMNIETGELVWMKNNIAPFNSQIKIFKDRFYIIDFSNTLRCFSLKDGSEIWNVKTQNSLIKSQKKLSLVIVKDIIFFNNSIGDISAANLNTGELLWQLPTQNSLIYESTFSLETSDIITDNKNLFFSNNNNQLFSIDINTGNFKWKIDVNSSLRSTIVGDILFSISNEGYLFLIDKSNGNIIRITDLFNKFKIKKRNLIEPTGFVIGSNNIYLSTNNGRLLIVDISTGKTISVLKIDNDKILRPLINNQNLYTVKDKAIIKLN
jgi:outer membrane protein assembly factor BamB